MNSGIGGVLARIHQLDGQMRGFDASWIGLGGAGSAGAAGWAAGATFDQVLSATGATADAAGVESATASGARAAAATAGAAVEGTSGAGSGTTASAAATATSMGGSGASGAAALGTASEAGWAVTPAEARRIARTAAAAAAASAASGTILAPDATTSAAATGATDPVIATGKGIGGGIPFRLPISGAQVSQDFGPTSVTLAPAATWNGVRYAHFHKGIDYAAPEGTPVTAAAGGTVVQAGRVSDGAVNVVIRHANGVETLYGHLQADLKVRVGQKVTAGDVLGEVGMTGRTTGPHLHFTLTRGGVPIDPAPLLERGILPGVGKAGAAGETGETGADGAVSGPNLAAFDALADGIPYAKQIRAAAVKAGIDPLLLASLVKSESGFRPNAVSYAGAQGLCQLMPATSKALGISDPFDAAANLEGGARYLANNLRLYGRVDLALAAYQAGKGAVDRAGGMPPSETTRSYVAGITRRWNSWLKEGSS